MKKFAALLTVASFTALASPMAFAKAHAAPKAASHAPAKHVTPPRGPNGRFLPRAKA